MLQVEHLVKQYKNTSAKAVDDVSFSAKAGSFFALLGPNGAGKTTTLSILTTTLNKTSGVAEVAGFDVQKNPQEVRKRIGVIFQNPSLDKNLTGEENLRLHAQLYGIAPFRPLYRFMPAEYKKMVEQLTAMLGIEGALFQPVKTYSGGMARKLEIARSLLHKPQVLFLDEPTSGLDPFSRKTLWQYLLNLRKQEGCTLVLTTHYLEEAEHADEVVLINKGKVAAKGTPAELKHKANIMLGHNGEAKRHLTLEDAYLEIIQEAQ